MTIRFIKIFYIAIGLFLLNPILSAEEESSTGDDKPPYIINEEGKVDIYTRVGWKVFHLSCHGCHGVNAVGTDVAPSLVEALKGMSKSEFITKVLTRYRITVGVDLTTGRSGAALRKAMVEEVIRYERSEKGEITMPAWSQSPYVSPHVTDLYAYLKARSDGALGCEEPISFDP
ncbi:MAG: cytochrome c [Gammaproteobacteria bacterium]